MILDPFPSVSYLELSTSQLNFSRLIPTAFRITAAGNPFLSPRPLVSAAIEKVT
jgi:hypothetical protein